MANEYYLVPADKKNQKIPLKYVLPASFATGSILGEKLYPGYLFFKGLPLKKAMTKLRTEVGPQTYNVFYNVMKEVNQLWTLLHENPNIPPGERQKIEDALKKYMSELSFWYNGPYGNKLQKIIELQTELEKLLARSRKLFPRALGMLSGGVGMALATYFLSKYKHKKNEK